MVEKEIERRVQKLEIKIATQEQRMSSLAAEIKDVKNTLTWINRLILGALILQIFSFYYG
ncbi:hemolysin XhlA family protein [Alkalihalobacillus sp. 1P02AB]|uniref:hemolysin XhlA family protein n=1 Tax=Alkalihalobacillus sp. 1P02AB TaxID=3132260 RepID=UPI0039A74451